MARRPRPAKPKVIVTRRLPPIVEARMGELFDTQFNAADQPMDRAALAAAMADCDVLVPTVTDVLDAELLAAAPDRLQLIASFGSGVDHGDFLLDRKRRIEFAVGRGAKIKGAEKVIHDYPQMAAR